MTSSPAASLYELVGAEEASIQQVWLARLARTPTAPFLNYAGRTWTYAEAWAEILRTAARLRGAGLSPGGRVAGYLSNTPHSIWAWFGALAAGAVFCPLNRAHKGVLLAQMLKASGANILITEEGADASFDPSLKVLIVERDFHDIQLAEATAHHVSPYADAVIMYTSGSTGGSKAVRLSHQLYCHQAARVAEAWAMNASDVYHAWLPHYHVAGTLHQTMATIIAGGQLALFERYSASAFMDQVREVGATIVVGLPNVVNIMWASAPSHHDRSSLRLMISTAINPAIHRPFETRFGLRLIEQYGMTEAELITLPRIDEQTPAHSCGKPGEDWDLIIADSEDRALPPGVMGEILVRPLRAGILSGGYDGDSGATERAWRNLWFHTGDFGRLDESGFLYFMGRGAHVIRRRSENISALELERILETHPDVMEAAALGVPSPLGEEDVKVVVRLRPGSALRPSELHAFCKATMARFMTPRFIEIVEEFPRTQVGKIAKTELCAMGGDVWDSEAR